MVNRTLVLIGSLMGGVGTHLCDLMDGLSARKWRVYFFDLKQPFFSASLAAPRDIIVTTIDPPLPSHGTGKDELARAMYESGNALLMRAAVDALRESSAQPALIHCHDYHGLDAAAHLSRALRVPLVTTVHSLREPMIRWTGEVPLGHCVEAERRLCEYSDAVIAVSTGLQQVIHATHPSVCDRTIVIHNGVNIDSPAQRQTHDLFGLRAQFGLDRRRVILYAGRLTREKNLTALLQSAISVISAFPDAVYLLAGDDRNHPYVREMRRIVEECAALRSSVRFIGTQRPSVLAGLYAIASLVVMPSLYEGLPYFALEAMAAGAPIVAAATTGLSDLIEHRISGMLVPMKRDALDDDGALRAAREVDVQALAAAQMELLGNPALAKSLGAAGRNRVVANFTKDKMLAATINLYQAVADRGPLR